MNAAQRRRLARQRKWDQQYEIRQLLLKIARLKTDEPVYIVNQPDPAWTRLIRFLKKAWKNVRHPGGTSPGGR